ncbi:MAG: hypothetical protein ACK4ZE_03135 [Sphingorhabdus sp.]
MMTLFRIFLATIIAVVGIYTAVVVANHGMGLLPVFFGDIAKMEWPGQFNMDFLSFLLLGGFWLMWRHHFSVLGIILGVSIFAGGAPYLCAYLLLASFQAKGDVKEILLGRERAAA